MSKTIVILLIVLIIMILLRIGGAVQRVTKKDTIKFYKQKLESAQESTIGDGSAVLAFFVYLATELAIVYFAVQSIFEFIK